MGMRTTPAIRTYTRTRRLHIGDPQPCWEYEPHHHGFKQWGFSIRFSEHNHDPRFSRLHRLWGRIIHLLNRSTRLPEPQRPRRANYRMVSQSGSTVGTINQPIGRDFWHPQRLATDNTIHDNCRELRRLRKHVNSNRSNRSAHLGSRILSTIIRPLCRGCNPHKLSYMGGWQSDLLARQSSSPQWLPDGSVDRRDLWHCNRFTRMVYSHDMG